MATFRAFQATNMVADEINRGTGERYLDFNYYAEGRANVMTFGYRGGDYTSYEGNFSVVPGTQQVTSGVISSIAVYDQFNQIKFSVNTVNRLLQEFVQISERGDDVDFFIFRGDDNLTGSSYADVMMGFAGNDMMSGGDEDGVSQRGDVLLGNGGDDVIYGNNGHDSIVGGSSLTDAEDGNDRIFGGHGNDHIYGSGGHDYINGGSGHDLIVGGEGNDEMRGEAGNDIFVFFGNIGSDRIVGFAEEDVISINRTASIQSFSDLSIRSEGGNTIIDLGSMGTISLAYSQVELSALDASDFYFYG